MHFDIGNETQVIEIDTDAIQSQLQAINVELSTNASTYTDEFLTTNYTSMLFKEINALFDSWENFKKSAAQHIRALEQIPYPKELDADSSLLYQNVVMLKSEIQDGSDRSLNTTTMENRDSTFEVMYNMGDVQAEKLQNISKKSEFDLPENTTNYDSVIYSELRNINSAETPTSNNIQEDFTSVGKVSLGNINNSSEQVLNNQFDGSQGNYYTLPRNKSTILQNQEIELDGSPEKLEKIDDGA